MSVIDRNGDPVSGARVSIRINDKDGPNGISSAGRFQFDLDDPDAVVSVSAEYRGLRVGPVKLASDQREHTFTMPVTQHHRGKQFLIQHFPGLAGILFILLAVVLAFAFGEPTALQRHIILAVLSLGGGGFGGEIAGFINADLKLGKKLVVSAGGAAAIFLLLFFFVPAGT